MASVPSPDGDIDEEEELEWQKIAEVMNVIEQQYIDARNSLSGEVSIPTNNRNPFGSNAAPPLPAVALQSEHVVQPNVASHDPNNAAPQAQQSSLPIVPQTQAASHALQPKLQSSNPAPPSTGAEPIIPNQSSGHMPAQERPLTDVDALKALVEQQRGSLANHQNRMRAMQAELDSLRALDIDKMRTENTRLTAALTAATQESSRLQEQLSYAKQELSSLRDRRKVEAIAMAREVRDAQNPVSPETGTQIPGTQVPTSQVAGSQMKSAVERNVQNYLPSKRPPPGKSRRRPRPLDQISLGKNPRTERENSSNKKANEAKKTNKDSPNSTSRNTYWQIDLGDHMNNTTTAALRQHLFSGPLESSLWQLARVAGQESLRDALLAGISDDDEWPNLLEPLTSMLNAGKGVALTSLDCTYALLLFSDQCRRNVDMLLAITSNMTEALKGAAKRVDFEIADKCLQVLRVMFDAVVVYGNEEQLSHFRTQVFSNVVLNWTRRMRVLPASIPRNQQALSSKVRHSALSVLEVGVNTCLTSTCPLCDEDVRVLEEALTAASEILRVERYPPQSALAMLTTAACHAPSTVDENGVAALTDACVCAIQILRVADREASELDDGGVWKEDIVRQIRERRKLAAFVRGCIATLALISRTRDLVLRKSERNVALGVLSALAWPSKVQRDFQSPKELRSPAFVAECRTVWIAFRNTLGT